MSPNEQRPSLSDRLATTKVTPLVFVAFFAVLAAMSLAATGIGYLTHYLAKPPAARSR